MNSFGLLGEMDDGIHTGLSVKILEIIPELIFGGFFAQGAKPFGQAVLFEAVCR